MNKNVIIGGAVVTGMLIVGIVTMLIVNNINDREEGKIAEYQRNQEKYREIADEKNAEATQKGDSTTPDSTVDDNGESTSTGDASITDTSGTDAAQVFVSPLFKPKDMIIGIFGTDERSTETSRSDIIIVAKYIAASNTVRMLPIPRDTRVEIPGRGVDKINHAFAFGGAELLTATLEQLLDIETDHYVRINFESFKDIIDEFDGVEINAKKRFSNSSGTMVVPEGRSTVDGAHGLFYVRYRSDSEGDFGRIKRQQEVIEQLARKVSSGDKIAMSNKVTVVYNKYLKTDIGLEVMLQHVYANNGSGMTFEGETLITRSKTINGIWYEIIDQDHLTEIKTKFSSEAREENTVE